MVRVSIDVEAANGVVASMRAVVASVIDEWSDAAGAAHRALVSTASLRGLADPLEEIGRLASELELRVLGLGRHGRRWVVRGFGARLVGCR